MTNNRLPVRRRAPGGTREDRFPCPWCGSACITEYGQAGPTAVMHMAPVCQAFSEAGSIGRWLDRVGGVTDGEANG